MRVALTGASGDFATAIMRRLLATEEVESVLGVDVREPRLSHEKLSFEREDVRSPRLRELFEGCEAVVHLAFVIIPGRDREAAHDVNINGSRNVLEAAAGAGVKRLVVASSMAAYGTPAENPGEVGEDRFPGGSSGHFYFEEKAELEHLLDWWELANPDAAMTITRFRPGYLYGPDFDNPGLDAMLSPLAVLPDDGGRFQLVHQDDLARAFCAAIVSDAPGPFHLTTEDSLAMEDVAVLHGQRVLRVPTRLAELALDALHALRLSRLSSDWAVSGDPIGRPERARKLLGWEPELSSRESALVLLLQRGRPVRYLDGPPRREVLEKALAPCTDHLRLMATEIGGMAGLDIDAAASVAEHEFVSYRDLRVHLEVHEAAPAAPTCVFSPGLGDHARLHLPLAARLREEGFNVVLVDRPGHGLSEGRRGDAPVAQILDVIELAIAFARSRFAGPVVLGGTSLGGFITWYALTREPDVEAAFCHDAGHPRVFHEPSMRVKAPAIRALARVAPHLPIPAERLADYDKVALEPLSRAYFAERVDGVRTPSVTARTVASFFDFEPQLDWGSVRTPTLVLSGGADEMVTPEFVERVLARARPPGSEYLRLEGCGHMLFHDHLAQAMPRLVEWMRAAIGAQDLVPPRV